MRWAAFFVTILSAEAAAGCPDIHLAAKAFQGRDDRGRWQKAIDSADACEGTTIRLPAGVYPVSSAISLQGKSGIRIAGVGPASVVRFTSPKAHFDLTMAKEVAFDSLAFEYRSGRHGIHALISGTGAWGPRKVAIRGCSFSNCGIFLGSALDTSRYWGREADIIGNSFSGYQARVLLNNWAKASITGNTVSAQEYSRNPDEHNISGIRLENGSREIEITGNTAFKCAQNGIQVHSGREILIADNLVHDNDQSGIGLNSEHPDLHPERVQVIGNVCRGNRYDGIDINVVPLRTLLLTLEGNACLGNVRAGIYVHGAIGVTILGNACFWNGNAGIHVNRSEYAVVSANRLFSNDALPSASDSDLDRGGITLQGSAHCAVVANVSGNEGRFATQSFGIHLADGVARSAIHGNRVEGNRRAGVKLTAVDSRSLSWDEGPAPAEAAGKGKGAPPLLEGRESPEGLVSAPQGSVYRRKGHASGESWFVKEGGKGPKGWREAGSLSGASGDAK